MVDSTHNKEIRTLSTKIVYENRWMTVREDTIGRDDGYRGIYGVVDKPDFVVIIALSGDDVYLVEQYRYPVKGRYLEFPQGAKESAKTFDALAVAKAELQEECGLLANHWQFVGEQFLAHGMCSQRYHIFVATELTTTSQALEEEEQGLTVHKMPRKDLKQRIVNGDIMDATTCNAFGLATLHGFL